MFFFLFFFSRSSDHRYLHSFLHDALPIWLIWRAESADGVLGNSDRLVLLGDLRHDLDSSYRRIAPGNPKQRSPSRSEEHTSELQSPDHLVCRLLLEKKKTQYTRHRLLIE